MSRSEHQKKRQDEHRRTKCHFFNGILNERCDKGVKYDDLTTDHMSAKEHAFQRPCTPSLGGTDSRKVRDCDYFRVSTEEEIAAEEKEISKSIEKFMAAGPAISMIKMAQKGHDWRGVIECPVCGGRLNVTHAGYNGHVSGRCDTKDCLAWME